MITDVISTTTEPGIRSDDMDRLFSETSKCCVSIIIGTRKSDRKYIRTALKKAIAKAGIFIYESEADPETKQALLTRLTQIGITSQGGEGIGWYLSPNLDASFVFPFEVKDRVSVGNNFSCRELAYLTQFSKPFLIVSLSAKSVHLFRSIGPFTEEIRSSAFPVLVDNAYEYARPSLGSSVSVSLKAFEREKSQTTEVRIATMLRQADKALKRYMKGTTWDIILAGPDRMIHTYSKSSELAAQFTGTIKGSFGERNWTELFRESSDIFRSAIKEKAETLLANLVEDLPGQFITGLVSCWKTLHEGRAMRLFLDLDCVQQGYVTDQDHLHLHVPDRPHKVISDIINSMIITARKQRIELIMVPGNVMVSYGHAAAQERY